MRNLPNALWNDIETPRVASLLFRVEQLLPLMGS
jgi:hypothetical protein